LTCLRCRPSHDTDILTWSERQAALLRRLATGERVNNQVDWEHVAEEIESVGARPGGCGLIAADADPRAPAQGSRVAGLAQHAALAAGATGVRPLDELLSEA